MHTELTPRGKELAESGQWTGSVIIVQPLDQNKNPVLEPQYVLGQMQGEKGNVLGFIDGKTEFTWRESPGVCLSEFVFIEAATGDVVLRMKESNKEYTKIIEAQKGNDITLTIGRRSGGAHKLKENFLNEIIDTCKRVVSKA